MEIVRNVRISTFDNWKNWFFQRVRETKFVHDIWITAGQVSEMIDDILDEDGNESLVRAAVQPEFEKKRSAEASWPEVTEFMPPTDPWLQVLFEVVGGFNDAVGRLDTQVALFTVDVYVPLARYAASLRGTLGKDIRGIVVDLSEATVGRPGNLFWRTFGKTGRDEAHGRVVLELEYTVSPAA